MKNTILSFGLIASLSLPACGTINGAGQDFQNWGNWLDRNFGDDQRAQENSAPQDNQAAIAEQSVMPPDEPLALRAATDCPNVILKPMMSTVSEFSNSSAPSENTLIAKANLVNAKSNCAKNTDYVTVSLDLQFDATLGPKAKQNPNDKPYFSFPYFIAVTDYQGNELAREVFAASFAFAADETQHGTQETIEQNLPLSADGALPNYYLEIGFELTDEQRAYNNANRGYF